MTAPYTIIVGNIGTVGQWDNEQEARKDYAEWVSLCQSDSGRANGEPVTLTRNGEILEEHEGGPFRGSFMQPQVYRGLFFKVETSQGDEIVPVDSIFPGLLGIDAGELAQYVEGDIEDRSAYIKASGGVLARLSAPGYMDCTGWTAHDTEEEAMAYLVSQYAD